MCKRVVVNYWLGVFVFVRFKLDQAARKSYRAILASSRNDSKRIEINSMLGAFECALCKLGGGIGTYFNWISADNCIKSQAIWRRHFLFGKRAPNWGGKHQAYHWNGRCCSVCISTAASILSRNRNRHVEKGCSILHEAIGRSVEF